MAVFAMLHTVTPQRKVHALGVAKLMALAIAVGVVVAVHSGVAAVKVRSDFDKTLKFPKAPTWGWNPKGAGDVILARTKDDDPVAVKKRAEPVIMDTVSAELPRRGLKPASGAPDLTLTYYLLLTVGSSAQTAGQFLPATAAWGLPFFPSSTTSLEMIEKGSLVLDWSANGQVVWRGIAEAQIKPDMDQTERATLLREAVREILERFPPKS